MEMIYTDPKRKEQGFLHDFYIDMEIGGAEDFELTMDCVKDFEKGGIIGCYGSEYGGIAKKIMSETFKDSVTYHGPTFRGILSKKIIEPPLGSDYKIVSGNVSSIINVFLSSFSMDDFFICETNSLTVTNYQFDRHCTLLSGLDRMLKQYGRRMSIRYEKDGKAHIYMERIKNYSNEVEFSSDYNINLSVSRDNARVNHLICLGKGELKDRTVIHLYLDGSGKVSTTKHYFGLDEIADVYDYSSAENESALISEGIKKLQSYEYEKAEVEIEGVDIGLYDTVSARDYRTGIKIETEITRKILKIYEDYESIEYKAGE
ncbi:Gp37-like protein [Anaerosacchariphilus polymeriproducens]|uniref:Uncharacterized protein n=1 Tax=Anaerosacchariphilus polymeriproducens TaxID=1812858 RepID=A0A371ARN8_9FIRM|nr:hypothetical protein [Anaerosacchariphilus polymeriproducens]RDU22214.1 hypothetical protein DWV06_16955 [Anaerosacchariphilus polymeriproducens]